MFCLLPLPLTEMRKSISLLSPIRTPIQGDWDLFASHGHNIKAIWSFTSSAVICLCQEKKHCTNSNFKLNTASRHTYRVQAFIQQLVDTRPDMVTREVVGKTIVSFSTSRGTIASIWMFSPQQGRNLDLLTITEPELAETEIDPNARKVKSSHVWLFSSLIFC